MFKIEIRAKRMEEIAEIINLIDLGNKTVCNKRTDSRSTLNQLDDKLDELDDQLNDKLINSEQSVLFNDLTCEMNIDEEQFNYYQAGRQFNQLNEQQTNDQLGSDLNHSTKNRASLIKNPFKNLAINKQGLTSSRNNYEKLTDPINKESKYYGSFSSAIQSETTFNSVVSTKNLVVDRHSIATSLNSQNLQNNYLKEFEQEKHLNLLGFKTTLIVILSFCILMWIIFAFETYFKIPKTEKDQETSDLNNLNNDQKTWIVNSILSLFILLIGIIGLLKEKIMLILITSVMMMFSLIESDDLIINRKLFNIPLLIILSTAVLLIIFAARLRCYAEDKLNLINKLQYDKD